MEFSLLVTATEHNSFYTLQEAYPVVPLPVSTSEDHDAKLTHYIRNTGGDLDEALLCVIAEPDAERFPETCVSMKKFIHVRACMERTAHTCHSKELTG